MAMAADRPYVEFYDFYSISPECFGYSLIPSQPAGFYPTIQN
jgi:hypothetical protein